MKNADEIRDLPAWAQPRLIPRPAAERRVADLILRTPPITQAELTKRTDFTQQYVSKVTSTLLDDGVIAIAGRVKAGRGQPSAAFQINGAHACSIGASIMTDALALTLVDLAGRPLAEHRCALLHADLDTIAEEIRKGVKKLARKSAIDERLIVGLGVSMTGFFIGERNRVNPPGALDALAFVDIDAYLSQALGMAVFIDNDGNTAAAGEALLGVGRCAPTFAYIFLSAGLGGGLVINGRPFRGRNGNAGEYANIIRNTEYYPTLDTLRQEINEKGGDFATIEDMLRNFDASAAGVDIWLDRATEPMSRFASAITAICDPDAIVLGGRLPTALGERLVDRIEIYNSERRGRPKPEPKIVLSEIEGDAAALGAAMLPLQHVFY